MDTDKLALDIWQAFSTLSDAQEAAYAHATSSTIDMINHAKLHLDRALEELGQEAMTKAMTTFNFCDITR